MMTDSGTKTQSAQAKVLNNEQISVALGSTTRSEILAELLEGGPMGISTVAENLGASADGLYHHFMRLEEAGLIRLTGSRSLLRHKERVYEATAENFVLPRHAADPETRAIFGEAVGSFFRGVVRVFTKSFPTTPGQPAGAQIIEFSAKSSYLTVEEIERIKALNQEIDAILLAGRKRKAGFHYMMSRAFFPCTRERKSRLESTAAVQIEEPR